VRLHTAKNNNNNNSSKFRPLETLTEFGLDNFSPEKPGTQSHNKNDPKPPLIFDPEILSMLAIDWTSKKIGHKHKDSYLTKLMNDRLLNYTTNTTSAELTQKIKQIEAENKHTEKSIRSEIYKDLHDITSNPQIALARMLRKHVGKVNHSEYTQIDEYLTEMTQYERYQGTISTTVCTEIIQDIFNVYRPNGTILLNEEREEIIELYYEWIATQNTDILYSAFETWFLDVILHIIAVKTSHNEFDVDNMYQFQTVHAPDWDIAALINNCMMQ
jgi:hypothetical protein